MLAMTEREEACSLAEAKALLDNLKSYYSGLISPDSRRLFLQGIAKVRGMLNDHV